MVCATALLSSSLALSLLRQSTPPSESFVISPYSLDTALSVIHDGAVGPTQQELTNLLLNGCTSAEVTAHYSSLALSLLANNASGVTFKSANRFYVNESASLKEDYEAEVISNYQVKVENVNFREKAAVASKINSFVNDATEGMIKQVVDSKSMNGDTVAMFVNAIYFLGKWKFTLSKPYNYKFKGISGDRTMDFMKREEVFRVNLNSEFGSALILPYKDESYKFFFLMPNETSNINVLRDSLTGKALLDTLGNAIETKIDVRVPKFKVESKMDAVDVLQKLGVSRIFSNSADLSKISSTPLKVSTIKHFAVIEVTEEGTKAAAATVIGMVRMSASVERPKPLLVIDRPFLYGIMRNDDILFIGQYV